MYLVIYVDDEQKNIIDDCIAEFTCNLFASATGKVKMRVAEHYDGTATVTFYIDKGVKYVFVNVPCNYGYLDKGQLYDEMHTGWEAREKC